MQNSQLRMSSHQVSWLWAGMIVTSLLGVVASPVAAGTLDWSIGPHVGWARETDSKENGFAVGVASRLMLFRFLAGELAVDWRTQDIEQGEIKTIPVQLSGLLYVVPSYVHGTVGVGWYRVDASLDGVGNTLKELDDSASDAGLHLGAGVDVPLGSRTWLTTEGRYVWLGYELEEADEAIEVDADFFNLMVGLQFQVF